jgi:hypothetical protein
MNDRSPFELMFADAMNRLADEAPVHVDAFAMTAMIATRTRDDRRRRFGRPTLVPLLVGFLLALLLLGAAIVGARFLFDRQRAVVAPLPTAGPSLTPAASLAATAAPTSSPIETAVAATAAPSGVPGLAGSCAPMLQLMATYVTDPLSALPPGPPQITLGLDDVLIAGVRNGRGAILRFDGSSGALVPADDGRERAFASLVPVSGLNRFAASPDGRALSIEEGDFGQAGCGDPIVLLNAGGRMRPFPAGPFEIVSDVAWAPDGSAMYAVRRPTIDGAGAPFVDKDTGEATAGPGTVLRWDTATATVSELGSPCAGCPLGALFVSPDGRFVATET